MIPEGAVDTASYFSFYDVSEKIGIVIGIVCYGIVTQISDSIKPALLFFVVFFVVGVILLFRVPRN